MRVRELSRWNYEKREYEPYEVPDERRVKAYCEDMDEIVDCAACGTELPYGHAFTSFEIHTPMGIGYAVCGKCHDEEWKRRRKAWRV